MSGTGTTTHNTYIGDGDMNIAIGEHSVAKQTNYYTVSGASAEELLKLLAEIKARSAELPEEARDLVQHEVDGAHLYAKKEKPNAAMITAKLKAAQGCVGSYPQHSHGGCHCGRSAGQGIDLVCEDESIPLMLKLC